MITVLVADDHDLVRRGFVSLLSEHSTIRVVGEAKDGEQAIKMAKELKPDIVLMDIRMPKADGIAATKSILRLVPTPKVLIVTSCDQEPFPTRLLQAGASGFVSKGCEVEKLVEAIRRVYAGETYLSHDIAQKMAMGKVHKQDKNPFEKLSARELQVALLITSGSKVAEIATRLHLSPKTVNSYRYRIFDKLNVANDVELTHMAMRFDILEQSTIDSPSE